MHPMLHTAIQAARKGGEIILRSVDRLDRVKVNEKSAKDFVTDVDLAVEQRIIEHLKRAYPKHTIMGEESSESIKVPEDEYVWIIDPLDGTTNFIQGIPHFAVSIGLLHKGELEVGVIFDPMKDEIFSASRGKGATLNDRKIRVAKKIKLEQAIVCTGFAITNPELQQQQIKYLGNVLPKACDVRRGGAAALDLAYVACGRLDAYWEANVKPWDIAAGMLIVKEAGGVISDFQQQQNQFAKSEIVACNEKLLRPLLAAMK